MLIFAGIGFRLPMIRLNWLKRTEFFLKWGAIAAGGLAGLLGFLLRWESKDFNGLRHDVLGANEAYVWLTVPFFTGLAGALTFFKTHFGTTHVWKSVTHLLEEYRQVIFQGKEGFETDATHHNRVTLYKHVNVRLMVCRWPWSNWMVPVARTGHTTQTWRIPRFRAPTGEPDKAEGIAGVTFANNSMIIVENLPELRSSAPEKLIRRYARKGFVNASWIRKKVKRNGCSIRSLVGIPIEVEGKPWGAIVVDSRHPGQIIDIESLRGEEFSKLARLLSKLLEN